MGRKAMSIAFLSRHEHSVRNLSENTDSVASGEISVVEVSVDLAFWQW